MVPKALIRKQALAKRGAMDRQEQEEKSRLIAERFLSLPRCQDAQTIFLYAGYGSEALTEELCERLLSEGKQVAMPRVAPDGIRMDFYEITGYNKLTKGYCGILEPGEDCPPAYLPDVIVMPGAAFDRNRNRIGYGKGFYDRYLARVPQAFTAAFAFECQMAEEIPAEAHDRRPDVIVTEKAVYN